jgi:hypothetical protein
MILSADIYLNFFFLAPVARIAKYFHTDGTPVITGWCLFVFFEYCYVSKY